MVCKKYSGGSLGMSTFGPEFLVKSCTVIGVTVVTILLEGKGLKGQ